MSSTQVWILDGRDFVGASTADTTSVPPELARLLSDGERARLQRFLKPQRAQQFLLGRLLLRHVLRQTLGCQSEQIAIHERPGAAPQVEVDGRRANGLDLPGLSLSHSRGWLACAMGDTFPLGVDIEAPAPQRDLAALARVSFNADELRWLSRRPDHDTAFYRLWCAKEAIYKHQHNTGVGHAGGLPALHCSPGRAHPRPASGFLRHDSNAQFHLCLFSAVEPKKYDTRHLSCAELLKSSQA